MINCESSPYYASPKIRLSRQMPIRQSTNGLAVGGEDTDRVARADVLLIGWDGSAVVIED